MTMQTARADQALVGLKILDISTMIAAPMASTLLADFGAEVVKVELPNRHDPLRDLPPHRDSEPLWWKVTNRNKIGITLDLRTDEGREILKQLIPKFDVLVENFRPGTLEQWGLDCETLQAINPQLTILRVTGYGQTGPDAKRPGFARIAEAFSGFTYICGDEDRPPLHTGFPVADAVTGLFGAFGILVACYRRAQNPKAPGEIVDLSLFESMFRLLEFLPIEYDQLGHVRERSGTRSQYAGPSGVYRTLDGRWISISASAQTVFERLARAIGREDLIIDPEFSTNPCRVKNARALDDIISGWVSRHVFADVMVTLERYEVSGGPVNSIKDIFESEHFRARESIIYAQDERLGPVAMPGIVPKLTHAPGRVHSVGPTHGKDSQAYLSEALGLSHSRLADLRSRGVI